jgi:hypothetical protein
VKLSNKSKKNIREFFSAVLFFVIILVLLAVPGYFDHQSAVADAKKTIIILARQGQSDNDIASFYKFQEYPGTRIFEGLKVSGELEILIQKGRSK